MVTELLSEEWKHHRPSNDAVSDLLNDLICFNRENGNPWPFSTSSSLPMKIGLSPLEPILPLLYEEVYQKRRGYDIVCANGLWMDVRKAIRVCKAPTSSPFLLQSVYLRIVLPYERERDYRNFLRETKDSVEIKQSPEDVVGRLIRFSLPTELEDGVKYCYRWGRIQRYDEMAMEHECLLDDGRTIRTTLRDADVFLGRYVSDDLASGQPNGEVLRYLAFDRKLIKLESPKSINLLHKKRKRATTTDNERKVDRRVELTCCACGWQQEVGKMLKCSVCRFLSHSVCYGIVDEAGLDVERKRGFKCFCCDPQKPAPGCLAYDVARAVLKVRSQPKWSELRKRLGVTNRPHVSTTTEKGVVKNGENGTEKSTQQFSHFGTHAKSSVQTRAKRNQSTEAATNP